MRKIYFFLASIALLIIAISGCDQQAVFEQKTDLPENRWPHDSTAIFQFTIEDAQAPKDLMIKVRYTAEYEYRNLYIQYQLKDTAGQLVAENLENIQLFHAKTGTPLGSGVGGTYDIEQVFRQGFTFPQSGLYTLSLQHFMRVNVLEEIAAVGVAVVPAETK
jgi:gliding motility-associated lipoprotein GldH